MLRDLVRRYPAAAAKVARSRPAVSAAFRSDLERVQRELDREQARQRERDRRYWAPLRRELEAWRLGRLQVGAGGVERGHSISDH